MTGPRAIYAVTGAVLACVAALSVVTYRATEREVIAAHTTQQAAIATTVAVALGTRIDALALNLRQLSALPSIQANDTEYVGQRVSAAFSADADATLREVVRIDASGSRFGWTMGGVPTVAGAESGLSVADWAWFADAAHRETVRMLPIVWDPEASPSLRLMAVSVWRDARSTDVPSPDGLFAGLLGFVVDLDRQVEVFAGGTGRAPSSGTLSLLLGDGTLAVRRGAAVPAAAGPIASDAPLMVGKDEWTIRIETPYRVAVSNVRDSAGDQLALVILLMILVPAVAWALVRRERRVEEERRALQGQLLQAQKMDAIGKLAGGVAHDFNNLLTAILGYTSLILEEARPGSSIHTEATQVRRAAESAATLTQKLLAFSRRQVLQPQRLDLTLLLTDLQALLRRLLGERVELRFEAARDLWPVVADPVQIEQVIINLAVNGRDAMSDGGALTLAVDNRHLPASEQRRDHVVPAGDYVRVVVADDGAGMDESTQARLFEPFFTTKPKGKGTGLGLSTVYGIVKQSGGYIRVDSAPGAGTRVELLFPRAADGALVGAPRAAHERHQPGTETILLVEDDAAVRELTQATLERHGYLVLAAALPSDALRIAEQHTGTIALILSDVVMPGMLGPELARHVKELRPDIRVLFMSGYVADAITGDMLAEAALLQKPFSSAVLTRAVRLVLDAPQPVET
ncbi:MAG: ATP-binding protein [Vicinamibacterales bacterium]